MLFSVLLIVVSAAILVGCFAWARTDEDDAVRKIVVSLVQIMCLMAIVLGVVRLAERSATGPVAVDDTPTRSSGPIPSTVRLSPAAAQAQQAASRAAFAQADRQRQQALEADGRLQAENAARLRQTTEPSLVRSRPSSGDPLYDPGATPSPTSSNPPMAAPGTTTVPNSPSPANEPPVTTPSGTSEPPANGSEAPPPNPPDRTGNPASGG